MPAIIKIKGKPADVDFLNICVHEILPGCEVRTARTLKNWFRNVAVVDKDGCNEISMISPSDLHHVQIMAAQLGVEIVSVAYGSRKPEDERPRNRCQITFGISRNGRSETFDLSTTR